jgi:hypothetical protein
MPIQLAQVKALLTLLPALSSTTISTKSSVSSRSTSLTFLGTVRCKVEPHEVDSSPMHLFKAGKIVVLSVHLNWYSPISLRAYCMSESCSFKLSYLLLSWGVYLCRNEQNSLLGQLWPYKKNRQYFVAPKVALRVRPRTLAPFTATMQAAA